MLRDVHSRLNHLLRVQVPLYPSADFEYGSLLHSASRQHINPERTYQAHIRDLNTTSALTSRQVITTTVTRTIVKTSTSTTTNSYFNIRATGAVNALAGLGVFYFGNLGAQGIPFDDSQPVSDFKLDTDCSLVLYSNRYPVGTNAWVQDNAYLQFGEGYCNVPGGICDPLKCYVAGDLSMQCIGPEGQSYHSVCRWDRFDNDFIWFVRREAACGDDKRIFLSIE